MLTCYKNSDIFKYMQRSCRPHMQHSRISENFSTQLIFIGVITIAANDHQKDEVLSFCCCCCCCCVFVLHFTFQLNLLQMLLLPLTKRCHLKFCCAKILSLHCCCCCRWCCYGSLMWSLTSLAIKKRHNKRLHVSTVLRRRCCTVICIEVAVCWFLRNM